MSKGGWSEMKESLVWPVRYCSNETPTDQAAEWNRSGGGSVDFLFEP
ncbi:MAG: hypothetical protein R3C28_25180 [Pirellulaceae bacterium]